MKVKVVKRKNSKGDRYNISLELYFGYEKNEEGKIKHKRKTKRLEYYLYVNPKTPEERTHNRETETKIEIIRAEREKEYLNNKYGFKSATKTNLNFIDYFEQIVEDRFYRSVGGYGNWKATLNYLINYRGRNVSFEDVNEGYCEGFKEYLQNIQTNIKKTLSENTIVCYYVRLKAALNQAVKENIITYNPAHKVTSPKTKEVIKTYLTEEEIKKLLVTECRYKVLKKAFLFSCLTGLRLSDIKNLTWGQIQKEEQEWRINFHQKKTKGLQYHYIPQGAKDLLEDLERTQDDKVFSGLCSNSYISFELRQWMLRAGINKNITFHCARHTYATLLLTKGADLFTVSKLLGHKDIRATQIYAKIIDQKKIDAINTLNIL